MNFEQLLKNKKNEKSKFHNFKFLKNLKKRKFFEFQIHTTSFYGLILFQEIGINPLGVFSQEKTFSFSKFNPEKSISYMDFFIIFFIFIILYSFIIEFVNTWYVENIAWTNPLSKDCISSDTNSTISSLFFNNYPFCKKLYQITFFFNSTFIDFLNFYDYLF